MNRIQLTRQTPNHVEITKIVSTSQPESKIINCYCQKLISTEET